MVEQKKSRLSYKVRVICSNCQYGSYGGEVIEIPVGEQVKETLCPNCGCKTLMVYR